MVNLRITIPDETLEFVEKGREATGETRSEFIERILREAVAGSRERDADERYSRAYQRCPETEDEAAFASYASIDAFIDNPWDGGKP